MFMYLNNIMGYKNIGMPMGKHIQDYSMAS
jgi:hypothetical protein